MQTITLIAQYETIVFENLEEFCAHVEQIWEHELDLDAYYGEDALVQGMPIEQFAKIHCIDHDAQFDAFLVEQYRQFAEFRSNDHQAHVHAWELNTVLPF